MIEEIFSLKFISVKDCFIYLPYSRLQKFNTDNSDPLIVKLTQSSTLKVYYFSCSPQSYGGLNDDNIGICAAFANLLGLKEGEVFLTSDTFGPVPSVKVVHASAATEDDYEIMEISQASIEMSMMNQVQVVSVGQPITIWPSKTIHCNIVIGEMDPAVPVGRLAKMTDVVIEPFISKSEVDNRIGKLVNSDKMLKEKFNKVAADELSPTDENKADDDDNKIASVGGDESVSGPSMFHCKTLTRNKHNGLFRVVVIESDSKTCCEGLHDFIKKPYNVFVNKDIASWWQRKPIEDRYASVCRLRPVLKSFTKSTPSPESTPEIYVRLYPIEENCDKIPTVKNGCNWRHQPLFISGTVRRILKLRTGAKVKLELFTPSLDKKLNEVELISLPALDTGDVETWFRSGLLTDGNVLINGCAPMPMMSPEGKMENIMVNLHPASILCWPFSSAELQTCQLSVTQSPSIVAPKSDAESKETSHSEYDDYDCAKGFDALAAYNSRTLEKILKEGITSFELSLGLVDVPWLSDATEMKTNCNVLIVGSGNNRFANWLCGSLSGPPHYLHVATLDCKTLKGKKVDTVQKILVEELDNCVYYQPSVLVLLEIDAIAGVPAYQEETTEMAFIQSTSWMLRETISEHQAYQSVGVLATARSVASVSAELVGSRCQNFFLSTLEIPPLTKDDRINIIKEMINKKLKIDITRSKRVDLESIADRTESYVFQDLLQFVDKTCFSVWQRKVKEENSETKIYITDDDFEYAFQSTSPAYLKSINLFKSSKHSWNSIGGMKNLKETLTELIIWPSKYKEIYEQCPLRCENGVLLYGAPGTGKTLIASALAGECNLNFISIKGPELLSKYIGESEENVRNVFERAQKAKPCILFFDEFDSLAPRRGHDSTGVTDRVVNQLLTQMDGVEERTGVWVIAASSRPDLLDPALLRPGRIGHSLYCDLPSEEERFEILEILGKNLPLSSECDLKNLAKQTKGFSGADLQALLYSTQMVAYDELAENKLDCEKDSEDDFSTDFEVNEELVDRLKIEDRHLVAALKEAKPSLSAKEMRRYQSVYDDFRKLKSKENKGSEIREQEKSLPPTLPQKVTLA